MTLINELEKLDVLYIVDDEIHATIDPDSDDFYAYIEPWMYHVADDLVLVWQPENYQAELFERKNGKIKSVEIYYM